MLANKPVAQGLIVSKPNEVPAYRFEAESCLNAPPWSDTSGEQYPVGRTAVSSCKNGSTFKGYSAQTKTVTVTRLQLSQIGHLKNSPDPFGSRENSAVSDETAEFSRAHFWALQLYGANFRNPCSHVFLFVLF